MSSAPDAIVYITAYVVIPKRSTDDENAMIYDQIKTTYHTKLTKDPSRLSFYFNEEELGHLYLIEKLSQDFPKVRTKVFKADYAKNGKSAFPKRNMRALRNADSLLIFSNGTRNLSEEMLLTACEDDARMITVRSYKLHKGDPDGKK